MKLFYKEGQAGFWINSLLATVLLIGLCNLATYGQGSFTPLANTAPDFNEGVMLLMTDGTVLCKTSSGGTSYGTKWNKLTPDAHGSYLNGTWTTIAAMANERLYFSTQVLPDGRVYVAGGEYGAGGDKGEVYNPLTNTWTSVPQIVFNLSTKISDANSEIMADGKVLQAVVDTGNTKLNYLWDPATNTYAQTASCIRRDNEACWLKLPDNSVLFIDNYSTTSERYEQSTNTWINDGSLPDELFDPYGFEQGAAYLLPDGRGFFIGSTPTTAYYTPTGSTVVGSWAAGPSIPSSLGAPDAASAMMPNGTILMALSATPAAGDTFDNNTYYYEFDYTTNTFTETTAPGGGLSLPNPSFVSNMLVLPDGTVLYCNQGDDQYYEYTPASGPVAAGKPTLDSVLRINCDTFMATGLLFNGITEGAAYGDDWQMSTNYPIVRLTSGTNVYYARSYNWNRIGAVATGAALDTAMFVLPAGLPSGTYAVQVVANGNPSNTKNYNTSLTISPSSATLCIGANTTLTDVQTIGTWTSAASGTASIDPSSGLLTGVAAGTTTITYAIGACHATAPVTVNGPSAITPSGGINLCVGSSITLHDVSSPGVWTSTSPGTASIGTSSGTVLGILAGTATISYTVSGCAATENVTVNTVPTATITPAGPTTICPGNSVVLNASAGASYQWLSGGGAIAGATNSSYTAAAAGSYSVTVTIAAGCSATSAGTIVSVASAPAATITAAGLTSFCAGGSVLLNANLGAGLTYQWQIGGSPLLGSTSSSFTASGGGNYTVVTTNVSGCSTTSAPTAVTVTSTPSPITGTLTVCSGSTTPLDDLSGSGTWSTSNPAVATVSAGGIVTGRGTGGYDTITYTVGTGCSTTAVVTVNAASAAAISGPSTVCIGQTIPLTDGTPSGTWLSSVPARATVSVSGVVAGVSTGTTVISYQVSSSCGTATAIKSVTVNPLPGVATITGTLTACSGATSLLHDVTASGIWSSVSPAVATISATGLVTGVANGTTTISYTVTSGAGCAASATATFSVFSSLAATATASGATSFCTGGSVTLSVPTGTGDTYQWQKDGVNISGATSATYSANASGNYTVIVTAPGGCNATSSPITVTVAPPPSYIVTPLVSISASAGPVFCGVPAASVFTAHPTAGGATPTYSWLVNGVVAGSGSTFGYTPTVGDVVTVQLTSDAACAFPATVSASDTIVEGSSVTPSVSINASAAAICVGTSVTFSPIPVFGGTAPTYQWTKNGVPVVPAPGVDYIYVPISGDVLTVTLNSNYPCAVPASTVSAAYHVTTTPNLHNTISVTVSQSSVVAGSTDTFIAVAPNGGSAPLYQWLLNGSAIAGATNSIYVTTTLNDGDVIKCEVTSNESCVSPVMVTSGGVSVHVVPAGVQQVSENGDVFTLVPNPNNGSFTIAGSLNGQPDGKVTIVISDMLGQAVYQHITIAANSSINEHITLNSSVANGMYLVSITAGSSHVVYHMVVNR